MDRNTGAHCHAQSLRKRSEYGAAAVEFALVVPLLAMLLIGTVTVGLAYSDHVALTNAVREGARLGATAPSDSDWGQTVVDQTTAVYANANNPLSNANVCATMVKLDSNGNPETPTATSKLGANCDSITPPATPTNAKDVCVVKVWAVQPTSVNWLLGSASITLNADSVSLYDRQMNGNPTC